MKVGDKDVSMRRGWIAQFHNGNVICEDDMSWNKVPDKKNIRRMILKWEDRLWDLPDKDHYTVPKKRGYVDVSAAGTAEGIHSRTIGYYCLEESCKVTLRVEESTGKATWETEDFE